MLKQLLWESEADCPEDRLDKLCNETFFREYTLLHSSFIVKIILLFVFCLKAKLLK